MCVRADLGYWQVPLQSANISFLFCFREHSLCVSSQLPMALKTEDSFGVFAFAGLFALFCCWLFLFFHLMHQIHLTLQINLFSVLRGLYCSGASPSVGLL